MRGKMAAFCKTLTRRSAPPSPGGRGTYPRTTATIQATPAFEPGTIPSHLMRMRACIRGPQFLQLELICALCHDALTGFDARDNRDLVAILISHHHVAALELLARSEHVNDLFPLVIQNRFLRNQKHVCLLARSKPEV